MVPRILVPGVAAALLSSASVHAAEIPAEPAPAAAPASCKASIALPALGGVIKQNPNPACFAIGGLGDIYVGGVISGYAYTQTNQFSYYAFPPGIASGDRAARVDFSNLAVYVQKVDGPFQFYVQAGAYSIPGLGLPVLGALDQTDLLFGPLPVAFGKYVYNDNWSIQGGRMPTLIGTEATFTFQNLNISRGLLFNQENFINHGVQVNYSDGPWSISVAGTDGFFSGALSWLTCAVTYRIDDHNVIGVNGGLNLGATNALARSTRYQFATPNLLQNSGIFDVNYTYTDGPWTLTPYFQITNVERDPRVGILLGASTYGGAILANYAFNSDFSLAGRVEYIQQSGSRILRDADNVLYGPGSAALSFTITPTFTHDRYFLRGEYAHVEAYNVTPGLAFGRVGTRTSQDRFLVETGFVF